MTTRGLSKNELQRSIAEKRARASSFRKQADLATDPDDKAHLLSAAIDYEQQADRDERRLHPLSVRAIKSDAPDSELERTRRSEAVKRGPHYYLPLALEEERVLPSVLLRCPLFAAGKHADVPDHAPLSLECYERDVQITITGPRLSAYHRKVWAACLHLYKERPLASDPETDWVDITLGEMAKSIGLPYGKSVYKPILESLHHLSSVYVSVTLGGATLDLTRLIKLRQVPGPISGATRCQIQIDKAIAPLFKPGKWVSVPRDSLNNLTGEAGWLACFARTHSSPFPLRLDRLETISGSTTNSAKFKLKLKQTLDTLSSPDTPASLRVVASQIEKKKADKPARVAFALASWKLGSDPASAVEKCLAGVDKA